MNPMLSRTRRLAMLLSLVLFGGLTLTGWAQARDTDASGPVVLRAAPEKADAEAEDPAATGRVERDAGRRVGRDGKSLLASDRQRPESAREPLSEFERHVSRMAAGPKAERDIDGEPMDSVRRLGHDLLLRVPTLGRAGKGGNLPAVPDDYVLGPGDELQLDIWGGVVAQLKLQVSRQGTVAIPRVGVVPVAGVKLSELPKLLRQRIGQQFKAFDLAVSVGELRQVRVFVSGFVKRPGMHVVPGLANVTEVLAAAGGLSPVGSFRQVELRRHGALVATLDLYDLMLKGQNSADVRLQSGDVVHVPAVGPQVAVIGSVNSPAILELKSGETVADLIRMSGGLAAVALTERASVVGLGRNAPVREINLADAARQTLKAGEVLRVQSAAELTQPSLLAGKRIRIEGEVKRPGDYVLGAGATLRDAVQAAGGLTEQAFVYAAEFNRESVRAQQNEAYDRALRELEAEYTRMAVTRKEALGPLPEVDTANTNAGMTIGHVRLIERLRQVRPTGRVVLQLGPQDRELPQIALEDGDRLLVPSRPESVSVYGSVFNGGSYLFSAERTLSHYLKQAGGPTRTADEDGVFVLRADGSVVSSRARTGGSWWRSNGIEKLGALPGDTIFVPEELDRVRLSTALKDWALILSQFGLGAVALKNLSQ